MPFSYAQYAGNGSTTTFSVPFPYLLKAHVKLYTGYNILTGAFTSELIEGTDFSWTSGTQVQATVAPASGVTLTILRDTPDSSQLVSWQDGSNLIADDLNNADLQNLYVVQEQQDRNDAGAAAALAAQTAANSATAAANSATAAATAATTGATAATTAANAANATATAATAAANTATAAATAATAASTQAIADSQTALTQSSAAVSTANTAAGDASTALSIANTASTNASNAVTTANAADTKVDQAIASLLVVLYNRRPALHRGSLFYKTAPTTISIVAGAVLNGHLYAAATAVTMPSHITNTDYAIWQNPTTGALVGNASFTTAPAGATGGSIVGGYHYIASGRPTAVNNGSPTVASEILEFSLWDLTWRPACPDPRGMACIEGGFWMDLYLCGATSYAGSTFSAVPSSQIGLIIADGINPPRVPAQYGGNGSTGYANGKWFTFTEVAASFGKRLPRWQEFSAAAFGAPEASSRVVDPGTVQWERVSKFGLAQATGVLWQWGQETCTAESPSAVTTGTETDGRGQVLGPQTRAVVFGGYWGDLSTAGSRCALWNYTPWLSSGSIGARFAAGHLVLG